MQEGRALLAAGLEYLADESSEGARVALLHSPGAAGADGAGLGLGSPWVRGVLAAVRLPSRRPNLPAPCGRCWSSTLVCVLTHDPSQG